MRLSTGEPFICLIRLVNALLYIPSIFKSIEATDLFKNFVNGAESYPIAGNVPPILSNTFVHVIRCSKV